MSLITVNNIMVVTYYSKCHQLSLSLIAVNGITLMDKPYWGLRRTSHHGNGILDETAKIKNTQIHSVGKRSTTNRRYKRNNVILRDDYYSQYDIVVFCQRYPHLVDPHVQYRCVYYEEKKWDINRIRIYKCRCDERLTSATRL